MKIINKELGVQKVKFLMSKQKYDEETKTKKFTKEKVPDRDRDTASVSVVTEGISG